MSNYSISPRAYSPVPPVKFNKLVTRYLKSYQYHERIEAFYRREVERHRRGVPLPYSWEEFEKSFKAKIFGKTITIADRISSPITITLQRSSKYRMPTSAAVIRFVRPAPSAVPINSNSNFYRSYLPNRSFWPKIGTTSF